MLVIFTEREIERFWDKVSKSEGCWNWIASKYPCGYGAINIRRKCFGAHRMSWLIHHGDIPDDCEVCHYCDDPSCVRPDHLYVATHAQNIKDMHSKGRGVYSPNFPPPPKGELNWKSRFKTEDILEMRSLSERGVSQRNIAILFKTSHPVIGRIIRRESWSHV